jgi:hypothetical protein
MSELVSTFIDTNFVKHSHLKLSIPALSPSPPVEENPCLAAYSTTLRSLSLENRDQNRLAQPGQIQPLQRYLAVSLG